MSDTVTIPVAQSLTFPAGWEYHHTAGLWANAHKTPDSLSELVGRLGGLPAKFAQPDPSTLATIPKGGINLSYMGHAEVTLALIEADPLWTWEPIRFDPETGGPQISTMGNRLVMWGRLTVLGVSRICVGTCESKKGDPEKELIGDLLRNGAMRFGIGTKLWSKATDADPAGSGPAGGYDHPTPTVSQAALDLYGRVCAAKGTPTADTLKAFAKDNGRKLTAVEFDGDPAFAEQVAAILTSDDGAAH